MLDNDNAQTLFSVRILDRDYKVRGPADKINELKSAALYLDAKMREIRDSGHVIGVDRIAVIAALNITHEMLNQKQQKNQYAASISESIQDLLTKIENALAREEEFSLVMVQD